MQLRLNVSEGKYLFALHTMSNATSTPIDVQSLQVKTLLSMLNHLTVEDKKDVFDGLTSEDKEIALGSLLSQYHIIQRKDMDDTFYSLSVGQGPTPSDSLLSSDVMLDALLFEVKYLTTYDAHGTPFFGGNVLHGSSCPRLIDIAWSLKSVNQDGKKAAFAEIRSNPTMIEILKKTLIIGSDESCFGSIKLEAFLTGMTVDAHTSMPQIAE